MADVKVPMRATFDGSQLHRGVMQAKTTIGSLKSSVMSATSMMAGPLGFAGVVVGVEGLRRTLRNLADEDRQMKRLESSVRRFTGLAPDMARLNAEISRLQKTSAFGDTEIAQAFGDLVQNTGNVERAFENLELVLDLATATQKSLGESARLVGFAMEGMVEPLSRLSPVFRQMKQEGASAAEVMAELSRFADKARADDVKSLGGAFQQLANAFGEVVDANIKTVFNDDMVGVINRMSSAFFAMADSIESMSKAEKLLGTFLVSPAWVAMRGFVGGAKTLQAQGAAGAWPTIDKRYRQDLEKFGGGGGDDAKPDDSWYRQSVGRAGIMEWGQRQGADIDDQVKGMRDLRANSRVYVENWERIGDLQKVGEDAMREHVAQIQALSATLGSQLAGVFLDGQAGFKSMVDYWVRYLLSSGLTNLLANLFTGGATGGIFSTFFGGGGLGPDGASAPNIFPQPRGYGANSARTQQMIWRTQRG